MTTQASYEILLSVVDERALKAFALELNPDLEEGITVEESLNEALINPRVAPLDAGYEILRQTVVHDSGTRYRVRLEANVTDADLLVASAQESHRLAYGGDEMEGDDVGKALYEHVLGSNASPAHLDVGFEVIDYWTNGPQAGGIPAP